jgi:hypothetical protein
MFLLYYLRGITYGNIYEFLVECNDENCTKVWTEEYDLNEVAKTVNGPNADLGLEPFKVSLPFFSEKMKTDIWVKIRLLRGYGRNFANPSARQHVRGTGPESTSNRRKSTLRP